MKDDKNKEKSLGEKLTEELLLKKVDAGEKLSENEIKAADDFCEDYKQFLDNGKTEREVAINTIEILTKKGYKEFVAGTKYAAGDKIYYNNRGKAVIFATIGKQPIEKGVNLVISHIDSPRIDLKPVPLYEDGGLALFKTHYYGGIKKYQWAALPIALHGVVYKKNGEKVTVKIGDSPADPVFFITDLLPHLGKDQMARPLREGIKGEELNIVVGSRPIADEKAKDKVKLAVLKLLNEKYGMVEADFLSAELSLVPAMDARDVGFDRSMISSYGHDDRVCAYTSLQAALEVENPNKTHVTVFADKEETGSDGNTGLNSDFVRFFIEDLAEGYGVPGRRVLSASKCLSADVNVAFDPTFPEVNERMNAAFINKGVVITKYTGSGGKGGTNDASAEFMYEVRSTLDKAGIIWQTGELGKVDFGGGGTVAKFVAHMNVEVVDIGVPVLSMHAPYELVSKTDVYMTYLAFKAFIGA